MGSHGAPPPLCAWSDGKFHPDDPCLVPGANWQYELPLLRPRNFTMRDSTVNGGDDNVCIKNDTQVGAPYTWILFFLDRLATLHDRAL